MRAKLGYYFSEGRRARTCVVDISHYTDTIDDRESFALLSDPKRRDNEVLIHDKINGRYMLAIDKYIAYKLLSGLIALHDCDILESTLPYEIRIRESNMEPEQ